MAIEQSQKKYSIKSGKDVARYIDYFTRMSDRRRDVLREVNIVNLSGVRTYRRHAVVCEKCYELQQKYGIDFVNYIKFFLSKFRSTHENIERLAEPQNLMWYANELKIRAKHENVYKCVLKSAGNVARGCADSGFVSVREYLKHLIESNKLAGKYLSGEISRYYLAGLKNFRKIVSKMDSLNKDTLKEVVEQQEQLLSDVQDAFMQIKNTRVSMISLTNELFVKAKQNNNNSK